MDKAVKRIVIVAAAMVAVGLVLTGIGYAIGGNQPINIDRNGIHVGSGWKDDGEKGGALATGGKLESFAEELGEFHSIKADTNLSQVELVAGEKYAIEGVFDTANGKPEYAIENGTLIVEERNDMLFHAGIDINLGFKDNQEKPRVKIYYPKDAVLQDVNIKTAVSDLTFDGITAKSAKFELDLGRLELSNISADKVDISVGSGDCSLTGIKASDELKLTNNLGRTTISGGETKSLELTAQSGDVILNGTTIEKGGIQLNLGKLTGENLNTKGLTVKNQSGDIELSGTILGDTDISSNMGRVFLKPGAAEKEFNYELKTNLGRVETNGSESSGSLSVKNSAPNNIKVVAQMGDVIVEFND